MSLVCKACCDSLPHIRNEARLTGIIKGMVNVDNYARWCSLEPLTHRRNVASLSLFCRYYFGRCSSELAQLVPLPFSRGRSTRYSERLHDFSVTCQKFLSLHS